MDKTDKNQEEKRVFAAAKALILQRDSFLVIRQHVDGKDIWDFPGGKIEWGDSHEATVVREVKEETGLDVEVERPVGTAYFFRFPDENQVAVTLFRVKKIGERDVDLSQNPINENSDEMKIDDFCWMTKDEFLNNTVVVPHESYKKLISSLSLE